MTARICIHCDMLDDVAAGRPCPCTAWRQDQEAAQRKARALATAEAAIHLLAAHARFHAHSAAREGLRAWGRPDGSALLTAPLSARQEAA